MDFTAAVLKLLDDYLREVGARKETLMVCALMDKHPSLRQVEYDLGGGERAYVLFSGERMLPGGFRYGPPKLKQPDGFFRGRSKAPGDHSHRGRLMNTHR